MKNVDDRRMVLSRLAAVSGTHMVPMHKKPLDFASLVEATQFQAKGEELKKRCAYMKLCVTITVISLGAALRHCRVTFTLCKLVFL